MASAVPGQAITCRFVLMSDLEHHGKIYIYLISVVKTPARKHNYFEIEGKSMKIGRQIAYGEVIRPRQYQVCNSLASCLIQRDSISDYDRLACCLARCLSCCPVGDAIGDALGDALGDTPGDHNHY